MAGLQNFLSFVEGSNVFDAQAFDDALTAHGLVFTHYRSMVNPVGMVDRYDSRRPNQDNAHSSNGFIYTKAGEFKGLFIGNSKKTEDLNGGLIDSGTAQITAPRYYTHYCGKGANKLVFAPNDRLYLKQDGIVVPQIEMINRHESGRDRLRFIAEEVTDLVDSNNQRFDCGSDFAIDGTDIVWINPSAVGDVFSVRYNYKPYWYIRNLLHEIRVSQNENEFTGEMTMIQMPQSLAVQREYLFENEYQAENTGVRQAPAPTDGGFGSR